MNSVLKFQVGLLPLFFLLLGTPAVNGEVTVRQSGTTVTLRGDRVGDEVVIRGRHPNIVEISVNGGFARGFIDVHNIRINMGKGADRVIMVSVEISGNVEINLGGDLGDRFEMHDSTIGGSVSINGGSFYIVARCEIAKDLNIKAGLSADPLSYSFTTLISDVMVGGKVTFRGNNNLYDGLAVWECLVVGNFDVRLGGGDDYLILRQSFVGGKASFDGGRGYDQLGILSSTIVGQISEKNFEYYTQ